MRAKTYTAWAAALAASAYIGYKVPPFALLRRVTEHELPDQKKDPLAARLYTKVIETEMMNLSLVKELQKDSRYKMSRAWEGPSYEPIEDNRTGEVFTANTLQVPGGIAAQPVIFTDKDTLSSVIIVHVGRKVTGFPMIVHGGILATLLDEALGRTAFLGFPAGVGVTANLKLQYKAPSIAHQFLVIRTKCDEVNETGTKALVSGSISTLKGKLLVKSDSVFVVPKQFRLKRLEGL